MIQTLWKIVCQILIKLNVQLPCDPAIAFLDIYLRQMKHVYIETCTLIFTETLLVVAPN